MRASPAGEWDAALLRRFPEQLRASDDPLNASVALDAAAREVVDYMLRDFDLTRRMFRYPLSCMIDSPLLDALPPSARDAIYVRLWDVLSGLPAYFTPGRR